MAQYSILNKNNILEILKPYSIYEVKSFEVLSGGSENSNYKIESEIGKIVLTICEQKPIDVAEKLARLLAYLDDQNFSTSKLIHTANNKSLSIYNGKPVMVKYFLEGKVISNLPIHLLELIGENVAVLHAIEPPDYLGRIMWCGKERFNEVQEYAKNSQFDSWIKEIENYINQYISSDLPMALVHSDIFDNNVVVDYQETTATIMDFEEATFYYRVFDIAMLFIGTCIEKNTINFEKAAGIMKGYTKNIQLTESEVLALKPFTVYAAAGVAFWRHKNFNYTVPDEELKDSYLVMKNLADTIRKLPNNRFELLLK